MTSPDVTPTRNQSSSRYDSPVQTRRPDEPPDGGAGAFQPGSVRARRRTAINRKDATWQSSP
jgi:hypothetical protein